MRKAYVNGRFGQMHVRMAGENGGTHRPLVCFHLSPVSSVIYENWIREMGRDRLALAIDTPGYGMSDPPAAPPTIADFAAAMGDVTDALGIKEFDVMGYHTGSKICVETARQRPTQVKHLVLVSAPIYTEEDLKHIRAENAPPDPEPTGEFLKRQWQVTWQYRDLAMTPGDLMEHFPDHLRGGARRGWGHRAAFAYTYPETIVDVGAPILVFNPDDDLKPYTPRIAQYLKNGRVKDLPGWSHGFLHLRPAEAAALVRPFLDQDKFPD